MVFAAKDGHRLYFVAKGICRERRDGRTEPYAWNDGDLRFVAS